MGDVTYHVITGMDQLRHQDKVPIGKYKFLFLLSRESYFNKCHFYYNSNFEVLVYFLLTIIIKDFFIILTSCFSNPLMIEK